jgi:photosystem II stability/assembly factor-like uncharacterized protein
MSGLPRITFNNIVVNHHNANEVYIGSQKGIYRTMDGGFSWEHLGLDKDVITFLINPVERNKFIALTDEGLYSTVDDGNIWERADANLPKKVIKGTGRTAQELTIPIDLVSYINELNQEILVTSPDGIFVSDNDGKSWKNISEEFDAQIFNQKVTSFYYHDSIYYMGTLKAVYKSLNSGESWHKINILDSIYHIGSVIGISDIIKNGLMLNDNIGNIFYYRNDGKIISLNSGILTHSRIHAMGAKPIKNNKVRIFAVVENNFYVDKDLYGLFFTEDNGLTWRKSLIYKKPWDMRPSIFISPLNEEIWHFIGNDNALYYSENIGVEWSKIDKFNFHYSNDRIYDFVFDPIQSHIKYICAGVNDVFLFRYDQKTNNRMNLKVEAKKMLVARDDAKKLFTNTLKISTDGGWNWEDLSANVKNVASGKEIIPIYFKENNHCYPTKIKNNQFVSLCS